MLSAKVFCLTTTNGQTCKPLSSDELILIQARFTFGLTAPGAIYQIQGNVKRQITPMFGIAPAQTQSQIISVNKPTLLPIKRAARLPTLPI